jgi:SpoVK/Ycf46/Vps4 family AAA+-type ATPase
MEVKNFGFDTLNEPPVHHFLLPNSIRCIIAGPSGCGKTNLLVNLLTQSGWLHYDRLYVYSKSLNQDQYKVLRDWAEKINKITAQVPTSHKPSGGTSSEVITFHDTAEGIIPVDKLDPKQTTVLVFDDVMLDRQAPIESYFARGRHNGANCFYLTQNYFKIPNQVIRENANMLILFGQNLNNVRCIHSKYCSRDMGLNEFYQFFQNCTADPFGFCTIDLSSPPYSGKYRKGLDCIYTPHANLTK